MGFSFDIYNKLKQSKMFLANPQKNYVCSISGAENVKLTLKFNNLWELEFVIYEKSDNEYTEYYDKIVEKRLIELQGICWFQIQDISEAHDDTTLESYKTVKCLSLENELIGKKIHNINGVYALYDNSDVEYSLLHIISAESGYSIGHVDNELLGKYRTFSTDSEQIYNFLTTTVSKSFDCLFVFDTYNRSISAYKLANIGTLTDIVISRKNILKEYIKECSADKIITKLKVVGADGVDIRAVCPSGTNYLINLDYFLSIDWMSQSTIDAWNLYNNKYNDNLTMYNSTLSLLKTKQAELLTLETELTDLQANKTAQENIIGVSVELHGRVPIATDSDYINYQNAITLLNDYTSQIVTKKSAIETKKSEITSTQAILDNIGTDLEWSTNFTLEQIAEINTFISENEEYQDSTFVQSDTMSDSEVIDMKLELMQYGSNELARASQPQYVYQTTINNILTICDDKDELISYSDWIQNFWVGNLITIKFRDDYYTTARLMEMVIDFDDLANIEVKFSDKSRLDDEFIQLSEILANSGRTSSTVSLTKLGWDKAASQTNEVREFMNSTFNASLNSMINNDNVETEFGKFGIKNRQWLPDQNKFSDYQSWWNQNTLMFSNDGFKSATTAIGLLTAPDGSKYYGVATDVLVGNLILGNKLKIVNNSGTYSIDNNGFTATNGIYSAGINPSTPSEIINVKVNGVNQFYIDTTAQSLTYKGQITGGSININSKFLVSSSGILTAVDGIFSGKITALDGNIGGFTINETQLTAGTTNKFMRISPYSTTPGTNNYTSTYGAIDLGRTTDGLDTIIHLRSDGYARFGLASMLGAVKFNYIDTGGTAYSFYTPNFRIESDNGFVTARYIRSISGEELWLTSTDADLTVGADNGTAMLYGDTVQINGYNGTPLTYNGDNVITSATNYHGTLYAGSSPSNISAYFSTSGNFVSTSAGDLGTSTNRWDGAWLSAGYSTTSDKNLKNTISPLTDIYYEFFKRLIPVSFKYNDGTSDRLHIGFISQDVEIAMQEVGLSSLEFAGFIKAPIYAKYDEEQEPIIESGIVNYMYFLRYEEFIAINTYVTQKQESKLQELENRILQLESA